jgi:hypothetical protein
MERISADLSFVSFLRKGISKNTNHHDSEFLWRNLAFENAPQSTIGGVFFSFPHRTWEAEISGTLCDFTPLRF